MKDAALESTNDGAHMLAIDVSPESRLITLKGVIIEVGHDLLIGPFHAGETGHFREA